MTFATAVPLLMHFPLRRVARWITPGREWGADVLSSEDAVALVARIDGWLAQSRPFARPGCTTRGLTVYRFLRAAGAPVSLRFGVGTINGTIEGHCWIVYNGEPLCERQDPRDVFTEMWAMPS